MAALAEAAVLAAVPTHGTAPVGAEEELETAPAGGPDERDPAADGPVERDPPATDTFGADGVVTRGALGTCGTDTVGVGTLTLGAGRLTFGAGTLTVGTLTEGVVTEGTVRVWPTVTGGVVTLGTLTPGVLTLGTVTVGTVTLWFRVEPRLRLGRTGARVTVVLRASASDAAGPAIGASAAAATRPVTMRERRAIVIQKRSRRPELAHLC